MTGLIFEKIPLIMADIGSVAKSHKNTAQNYSFRSIDDIIAAAKPVMAKHGVFSAPEVIDFITEERPTRNGGALVFRILKVRSRFYATDGSFFDVVTLGEGCDSGDKASNKAMSAAEKYALLHVFKIPTEEPKDSEYESHDLKGREEHRQELFAKVEAQIRRVNACGGRPSEILGLSDRPDWSQCSDRTLEIYLEQLSRWQALPQPAKSNPDAEKALAVKVFNMALLALPKHLDPEKILGVRDDFEPRKATVAQLEAMTQKLQIAK